MWNEPTVGQLSRLPRLYATEQVPTKDKILYVHFFLGGCDWYAAEYDDKDRLFFGYAILNDDLQNAEWGYMSFDELRYVRTRSGMEVDRELHWTARRASEIERICLAHGWPLP